MKMLDVLELLAALVTLVSVWLTVKQNVWCWPVGAVGVVLYFVVFYQQKLYADMGLHAVYFVLQFYGWYQWLHGGRQRSRLPVSRVPSLEMGILAALGLAGTAGLGRGLQLYTDAVLPYLDSFLSSFSLVAQWLLSCKRLETWLVWITVDILYVGMFYSREMYPSAFLYALFLVLATLGYLEWKKALSDPKPA
jgi:nicotinamide mononucleotide transporter